METLDRPFHTDSEVDRHEYLIDTHMSSIDREKGSGSRIKMNGRNKKRDATRQTRGDPAGDGDAENHSTEIA